VEFQKGGLVISISANYLMPNPFKFDCVCLSVDVELQAHTHCLQRGFALGCRKYSCNTKAKKLAEPPLRRDQLRIDVQNTAQISAPLDPQAQRFRTPQQSMRYSSLPKSSSRTLGGARHSRQGSARSCGTDPHRDRCALCHLQNRSGARVGFGHHGQRESL